MDNPIVIRFSNEHLRPLMNDLASAYHKAKVALQVYEALGLQQYLQHDVGTFQDYLQDGSPHDGRPPISAGGLALIMQNMQGFIAHLEQPDPNTGMTFVAGVLSVAPFAERFR
ncbi:MAG: hypothetical protein KatS3mg038_1788 [Candidatus Kapaibacterium sp.]|nr:MAG: hypothetical protein KatS3mg038_1788 [Candidatus Kapabacteria bacterium]